MTGPDEPPQPEPVGGAETWGKVSQALILLGQVWAATRYRDTPRGGGPGDQAEHGPDGDGPAEPDAVAPPDSPPPDPARAALRQECEQQLHSALGDELWDRSSATGRRRLLDLAVDLREAEVTAETLAAAVAAAVDQAAPQMGNTDDQGRYVIRDPAAYLATMVHSAVVDAQAKAVLRLALGEDLTTELVRSRGWSRLADDVAQLATADHAALTAVLAELGAPRSGLLADLRGRHSANLAEGLRRRLPTLIDNARTTTGRGANPGPGPDPTRADPPTTDRADGAGSAGGGHSNTRTQPGDPTTPTLEAGAGPLPDIPSATRRITKLYARGQTGDEHDTEAAAALNLADRVRRDLIDAGGPAARESLADAMAPPTPLWRRPDPVAVLETATQVEGLRERARAAVADGAPTTETLQLWRQALILERELIGELGPPGWAALTAELARNPTPTPAASTAPGTRDGLDPSVLHRVTAALDRIDAAAAATAAATPTDIDQAMASRTSRADATITTPEAAAARNYVTGVVGSLVDQLRGDDPTARTAAAAALAALTPDGQLRRAALLQSLPTTVASAAPVPTAIAAAVSAEVQRQWTEPLAQITGSQTAATRFRRELLRSDELPRAVTALTDEGIPPAEVIGWFLSPGRQPAHGTLLQQLVTGGHVPGTAAAAWLDSQRLTPIVALTMQRVAGGSGEQMLAQLTGDAPAFRRILGVLHELQAQTGWPRHQVAATVAETLPALRGAADPAGSLAATLEQQVQRTRAQPVLDQLHRGFANNPTVNKHPGRLDVLLTKFSDGVTDPDWAGLVGQITAWSAADGTTVEHILSALPAATIDRLHAANNQLRYLTGVLRNISGQQAERAASRPARASRPPAPRAGPPAAAPEPQRRAPHRGRGGR